ncbi:MAG: hypothetical protein GYA36_09385 [Veillonellaceae bacterium]|nr:hypothetical protein [Veillonellaceae bacterium]
MGLRIVAAGSNMLIAEEVSNAVRVIVGDVAEITAVTTASLTDDQLGDIFVCAVTQREPLSRVVPLDKMVVLDLRPTSQFFMRVSRIPAGETVYIFNSNINYARLLKQSCDALRIRAVEFVPIAYEDMPGEEVITKLRQARYIIGVGKLVEKEALLSDRYRQYLRPDVTIIGNTRVATMQSAFLLIQRVTEYFHTTASKQIAVLAAEMKELSESAQTDSERYADIATEIEKLISESDNSILTLRDTIMKSFAAQIDPNISLTAGDSAAADSNADIVHALEDINVLSSNVLHFEKNQN